VLAACWGWSPPQSKWHVGILIYLEFNCPTLTDDMRGKNSWVWKSHMTRALSLDFSKKEVGVPLSVWPWRARFQCLKTWRTCPLSTSHLAHDCHRNGSLFYCYLGVCVCVCVCVCGVLYSAFLCMVLGFELRTLHLLGRHSATWATPQPTYSAFGWFKECSRVVLTAGDFLLL
jgi:hypothetical protein